MMRDVGEDVLLRWWRRAWRSNPPGPAPAMITRRVSMVVGGWHMLFLLLFVCMVPCASSSSIFNSRACVVAKALTQGGLS